MAKQFEFPVETLARRESSAPWLILSAVVLGCLAVLLIVAAANKNWPFASLALLALGAAAVFLVVNLRTARRTTARGDQKRIDWTTAQPEIQRQNLNIEVFELSKILEVESEQMSDLQSAYIVAEDLALRQIQHDENVPLIRHVTVGKAPFNAVFSKGDVLNCIDVFFLVVPELRQEKIEAMIRKIGQVKKTFAERDIKMKVRLMLVLVTQLTEQDGDRLRDALKRQKFENTPVDVDIRLLDFESLQKIYVTD